MTEIVRPGTTRKTHLTNATIFSKTPHLLHYWYITFDQSFYSTANKDQEYSNSDFLAKFKLTSNSQQHSYDAKQIITKILAQHRKKLSVVEKESSCHPFISGLPNFFNNADTVQDMRPDVVMSVKGYTFPIAVAEVISSGKTKLEAFYQATSYAMFMARFYAFFGFLHPGYCIVLPNPKKLDDLFGISIIKCQWQYDFCRFFVSADSIKCDQLDIQDSILKVLPPQATCTYLARTLKKDYSHLISKFIFKLKLELVNPYFHDKYEAVEQLPSAHAIVLKVKKKKKDATEEQELVIKIASHDVHGRLSVIKEDTSQLTSLVHHISTVKIFRNNTNCVAVNFPYLVPPLTAEEARLCLKDFVKKIHLALESIHQEHFYHGDICLENICFCLNEGGDDYDVRFIDLEMGYFGDAADCFTIYSAHSNISCVCTEYQKP